MKQECCAGAPDYRDTCTSLVGICSCVPGAGVDVEVCQCPPGQCFDGAGCVD